MSKLNGMREIKFHMHLRFLNTIGLKLGGFMGVVDGSSMEPTLHDGDTLCNSVNRQFRRGDIIIIGASDNGKFKTLVKRIVGLPGDRITIRNADNLLVINENIVIEPFIKNPIIKPKNLKDNTSKLTVVPKDAIFVLGDNRRGSLDSRQLGCIKTNTIIHKVISVSTKDGHYTKLVRPDVYDIAAGNDNCVTSKFDQKVIAKLIKNQRKQLKQQNNKE